MTEDAPLVLSASSAKTYITCGYRYLLENVYRLPATPNMAMAIGTAVHAGIEALHKGHPRPVEATVAALGAQLDTLTEPYEESPVTALQSATAMLEMYRAKVAPRFRPDLIEANFIVNLDGILVSGQIDAADENVRDVKTTAALTGFNAARHRFQLNVYRMGYRFLTGRWPKRLFLDVLTRNGRYKEVEIEVDPGEAMDVLTLTRDGIMAGSFDPTGADNGACRYCPYYEGACAYGRVD